MYPSESNTISPLNKWGIKVSKMRKKAFHSYSMNYDLAVTEWPEFKEEYDYRKSFMNHQKAKPNVKGFASLFPLRLF